MAEQTQSQCFLCEASPASIELLPNDDGCYVKCKRCGEYEIDGQFAASIRGGGFVGDKPKHQLWGALRYLTERRLARTHTTKAASQPPRVSWDTIDGIISQAPLPYGPLEQMDLIISHQARKQRSPSRTLSYELDNDFPIAFCEHGNDFHWLLMELHKQNLLEQVSDRGLWQLTARGWERARDLQRRRPESRVVFVAMWFDAQLDVAFEQGIKPALEELGFRPVRIDKQEHNNKICDEIIARIRECALLVADFTGQRSGVFFEAGFALGLGIPVVWSCREDEFATLKDHFDTRQYNHIEWKDPDELRRRLVARIKATALA